MDCAFREFFETSKISNAIIDKNGRFKKNEIITYCLEKNINVEKEKKRLFDLCVKHGVNYFGSDWNINFDVDKIIFVKPWKLFLKKSILFVPSFVKCKNFAFSQKTYARSQIVLIIIVKVKSS